MKRQPLHFQLLTMACAAFMLGGCGEEVTELDGFASVSDAGSGDLGLGGDGGGPLNVAFAVTGCASVDVSSGQLDCSGPAPLTLTFFPLATGAQAYLWSFPGADPTTSKDVSPTVIFAAVGSYAVTFAAGGPAGTTAAIGTVLVTPAGTGQPCAVDGDCDSTAGLSCICAAGSSGCPGALASGICSRDCSGTVCGAGELCADLSRSAASDSDGGMGGTPDGSVGPSPWRRALCLPACTSDANCRAGLTCRQLPILATGAPAGGSYSFQQACFADLLGDDGDSCATASGNLDPDLCLSGRCDPLGARGLCTSDCASVACPTDAACVTFNGTPTMHQCVRRCDASNPCTDPLLACEPSGQSGGYGFTVPSTESPSATYCAPRGCTKPSDCAPSGSCVLMGAASFCQRNG